MEDLIVILLMLAFTVIGGIAQFRKRKNQPINQEVNDESDSNNDFWNTILQDDEYELYKKLFTIINTTLPKPDLLVYLYLNIKRFMH